ncbi:hypothetical protein [Rubellicoccus peritrichatus]|uniref:Uncharacterized protein n=1 Tax=Rubellicoccus peritrichatus TaxID=3080537 RepID=A0AAQ3L741_9BACT|nr:hypothetical protein [Puniceicoccus sp. CR14]WOO40236.1 hypothetical protein RZN69_16570 [Puniceicoccus sp. CR14]
MISKTFIVTSLLLTFTHISHADLSKTHTASPLEDKWVYVRASEASTLFIEKHLKGKERFFSIENDINGQHWFNELSNDTKFSFRIKEVSRNEMDVLIHYYAADYPVPQRTLIYPFRDVDDTWVVIHFYDNRENVMRFTTLAEKLGEIEYLSE